MPKKTKRIKIVFFDICWSATRFSTQAKAEEAAEEYSQQVRYQCEAFFCDKNHPATSKTRSATGSCWHVRGVTAHVTVSNLVSADAITLNRKPHRRLSGCRSVFEVDLD